ncbi:DUF6221 family protein [Streptomyces massasporeus]|uniref:DUF6221 family protein n=1 Tax=Streptomyces massasporeus TaxID=67324 RepID=UPI0036C84DAE
MDELVGWLGAQLDEDERTARAATLGPWVQSGIGDYGWTVDFGRPGAGVETADTEQGLADASFIAVHNPARVLREIDATRRLLRAHEKWCEGRCEAKYPEGGFDAAHFWNIKLRAETYSDRPGYREEWRP